MPTPTDDVSNAVPAEDPMAGGAPPAEAPSSEKPFDDVPFDAGVEANEETDPKKYIEQLTGKLGQSLRKYNQAQGQPDFDLEKFAINSLLSATHTGDMTPEDQSDIIKKVEKAGTDDNGQEMPADTGGDEGEDVAVPAGDAPQEEPAAPEDELNEMSLNDHTSQRLIKIYDGGDDGVRSLLNRLVSYSDKADRNQFLKDLQDDVDYDYMQYIFKKLKENKIDILEPKSNLHMAESLFLDNPKKNNMFQEGSNDILDEKDLNSSEKSSIFASDKIKSKLAELRETFNQDDMAEPTVKPETKPATKPATAPKQPEPTRRNKPFLPKVVPGTEVQPKAVKNG